MNIAMVAGGSGGHIYPALALAEKCLKKGYKVCFIGANDRMEKDIIPDKGFPFFGLDVKTTKGGILQKISSAFSMLKSYQEAKKILKDEKTDVVIGFGNYISVPVILAAKHMGLKTAIHEQNSYVGRANRFLDKKVDLIIGSYAENQKQFQNPHLYIIGNPQSSLALEVSKDENYLASFGLDPSKKTLLIFLGSLGSESVMQEILAYFKLTDGSYQILYATGSKHYPKAKEYENDYIKIVERLDGVKAMKVSTLLLSRAGATTLAEISAIGMPSILIPSPYVPNNHQYYNAKALTDKNAAVMIEEKDLGPEIIKKLVEEYLFDDQKRKLMAKNAKCKGSERIIDDIIARIEEL